MFGPGVKNNYNNDDSRENTFISPWITGLENLSQRQNDQNPYPLTVLHENVVPAEGRGRYSHARNQAVD